MKKIRLDQEEKEVLEAFEAGKLPAVKNMPKERQKYQEFVKYTLAQSMTINIRIAEKYDQV